MKSEYNSNYLAIEERAFEIKRRMGVMIEASFEDVAIHESTDENITSILNFVHKYLPEADKELAQELSSLKDEKDKTLFIPKVTDIVIRQLATHLSLEDLELRLKSIQTADFGYEELHRGLTFEVNNDVVYLHVPPTFFNSSREALESFKIGLEVLADRLKNDDTLKNITEVVGHSTLVKDKYKLVSNLGFTVTLDDDIQPTDEAKISKEKLIELYGQNN